MSHSTYVIIHTFMHFTNSIRHRQLRHHPLQFANLFNAGFMTESATENVM